MPATEASVPPFSMHENRLRDQFAGRSEDDRRYRTLPGMPSMVSPAHAAPRQRASSWCLDPPE